MTDAAAVPAFSAEDKEEMANAAVIGDHIVSVYEIVPTIESNGTLAIRMDNLGYGLSFEEFTLQSIVADDIEDETNADGEIDDEGLKTLTQWRATLTECLGMINKALGTVVAH